ncbi:MAG: hypothetical protein GTN97_09145 [Nitrosopumilaceae archaeon]|nr:hypothetical protein [Nitrosopumilaceae archaeon]NIP09784.1 hypothetical protein [Nitrosopumilaceae archaeon]NIS96041.1 hypothetical protein [Nitrosopumilaceae archaeon]
MKISKIILYDEPTVPEINLVSLKNFLEQIFPIVVETRENILKQSAPDTAKKIAECKIFNLRKDFEKNEPTEEEISFEESNFQDTSNTENIVMYDGFHLQKVLSELVTESENRKEIFHVFFTNKLTCTYDYSDYRYHGRALIGANPSIISTTGIIEAPAKPRAYYYELMTNFTRGVNVETVKEKYKGEYLEYHDPRLSNIIEGYLLQAIFYYETGQAFCENENCRLFNAHWQKDLIKSQLEIGRVCQIHQEILNKIIKK